MKSDESKALRYLFFAERQASKLVAPTSTGNKTFTTAHILPSLIIKGEEDVELLKNLQSSGYLLQDQNQTIHQGSILLHVYPKSRLIEIAQGSNINSEYLNKIVNFYKNIPNKIYEYILVYISKLKSNIKEFKNLLNNSLKIFNNLLLF